MIDQRREPIWLARQLLTAIHDRQLAEHGGLAGVRDAGALESAAARPINEWSYGEDDRCSLAASLAYGIARNHPFADGNKRTAWVAARLFLMLNDCAIAYERQAAIEIVLALAAGELTQEELADWFRQHLAEAS
jgi:death-on-curing protein